MNLAQKVLEQMGLKVSEEYKVIQLAGGDWIVQDEVGTEIARERTRLDAIKIKDDLEKEFDAKK